MSIRVPIHHAWLRFGNFRIELTQRTSSRTYWTDATMFEERAWPCRALPLVVKKTQWVHPMAINWTWTPNGSLLRMTYDVETGSELYRRLQGLLWWRSPTRYRMVTEDVCEIDLEDVDCLLGKSWHRFGFPNRTLPDPVRATWTWSETDMLKRTPCLVLDYPVVTRWRALHGLGRDWAIQIGEHGWEAL